MHGIHKKQWRNFSVSVGNDSGASTVSLAFVGRGFGAATFTLMILVIILGFGIHVNKICEFFEDCI